MAQSLLKVKRWSSAEAPGILRILSHFGESKLIPIKILIKSDGHRGMGAEKWKQQDHRANSSELSICLWYSALCCRQRFLQKVILHFIKNCAGKN